MRGLIAKLATGGVLLALAIAIALYVSRGATASDHQDSPLTVSRPGADITDVFVFPSPRNADNVVLAVDVWPLIPAGMGPSTVFDPAVMYQFKIGTGDNFTEDLVIQFKANGVGPSQQITVYGPGKPNLRGVRSTFIGQTGTIPYNKVSTLANGMQVFAGPREDPFYFDLTQFFKILPDRNFKNQPNPPPPTASCFRTPGEDFLLNFNVLSLIVELPRKMLADQAGHVGRINVWTTTSLVQNDPTVAPNAPTNLLADIVKNLNSILPGADRNPDAASVYTQVERLGRPAVKEATENFADHDATNRSALTDDAVLASSIRKFLKGPAHRSDAVAEAVVKVLIPDAIEADLSAPGPARYLAVETNGKSGLPVAVVRTVPPSSIYGIKRALGDPYRQFGGRDLRSPVIDLSLGAIFGTLVPKLGLAPNDHQETPCLTSDHVTPAGKHILDGFPYAGNPR